MTKWNTGHDIADVRSLLECYVEFSITSVSNKCFNDTEGFLTSDSSHSTSLANWGSSGVS